MKVLGTKVFQCSRSASGSSLAWNNESVLLTPCSCPVYVCLYARLSIRLEWVLSHCPHFDWSPLGDSLHESGHVLRHRGLGLQCICWSNTLRFVYLKNRVAEKGGDRDRMKMRDLLRPGTRNHIQVSQVGGQGPST